MQGYDRQVWRIEEKLGTSAVSAKGDKRGRMATWADEDDASEDQLLQSSKGDASRAASRGASNRGLGIGGEHVDVPMDRDWAA